MATTCFSTVRGKRLRVTELDDCGAPVDGGLYVVSEGFITVNLTADIESGDEFLVKNANGALCINERSPDILKRLNVEVDWCLVDPDIIGLITDFPVEVGESPTDHVGFRITEGEVNAKWSLEVWTGLAGNACGEGEVCYGYFLVPYITGAAFGDVTIENGAATYSTTGYTLAGSGWGVGPWDVIDTPAAPLSDPIADDEHALIRTTCVAPPAAVCGAQTIPES
jgi:hypothetical protein